VSVTYDWKRFWSPRGETIQLSDLGFLYDPESEYGRFISPGLATLDQLADEPCLALLGEPGIGKSCALDSGKANAEKWIAENGHQRLWLDLRDFGSEERLWKALFENKTIQHWREADYLLYVFLDSLDECLLRIDNVAAIIADQLPSEPVGRLRLRIACRTAPWPPILERALTNAFDTGFKAYELAPLRRLDVQNALERRGVSDPALFFARVDALDLSSFAIKPVTLNFLIDTYLRNGALPENQIDLYESGCRILCEELNESRISARQTGQLGLEEKISIASRIAALTQFCNRFAVWTGPSANAPQEDIVLENLTGIEQVGSMELAVSNGSIREVLDTGLFSARGANRIGWAHLTYSEYLAARYCVNAGMPTGQVQALVFHPGGGGRHLVPQMYDIAAWLSVMNPAFLDAVANADPESLLGVAGASLSPEQRKIVVTALLRQSEAGRLLSFRWSMSKLYPKLAHEGLCEQLRSYVCERSKSVNTRHVAIDIARSCAVGPLGPDLVDLALDATEQLSLRIAAGSAAAQISDRNTKARLRPFALGQAGDDPDDEMKGIGLIALWPDWLSSTELFELISPLKNRQLHGAYASFLYQLSSTLRLHDLPIALEWYARQQHRDMGPIDRLMDGIIRLAVNHLDSPEIAAGFVEALLSRMNLHDQLMSSRDREMLTTHLSANHLQRQDLLERLLTRITDRDLFFLEYAGFRLVPSVDLPWLIQRGTENRQGFGETEVKLIRRIVDPRDPEQMRLLWFACQRDQKLNEEFSELFFISLDSASARILREEQLLQQKYAEETTPKLIDPPPCTRIEQALMEIELGKCAEWVRLAASLSLTPTSSNYEFMPDLSLAPGWITSEESVRTRILGAAYQYIHSGEPESEKWFATSETYYVAIAGFQAIALVFRVSPERLDSVPSSVWEKWVPILLQYPHGGEENSKLRLSLLKKAHLHAPGELTARILQLIDAQNGQHGYLFLDHEIDICWDEGLANALFQKLTDTNLKAPVVARLLQMLLKHKNKNSREAAKAFIVVPPPETEPRRELMIGALEAILSTCDDADWCDIWPLLEEYPTFGRSLIESVSYGHGGAASFLTKLTAKQLGEFYAWMLVNYPPSGMDHKHSGAVGPSQTAVMLRDTTLEQLKKKATFEAVEAIRHVLQKFPDYSWLAYHLEEAESLARAATWEPVEPSQLLALVRNRGKRLLDSTEQLMSLLFESLDRLQSKLKGELASVTDLWNVERDRYWPKDEESLSNYVARHFLEDILQKGIVVNREVQIRPGQFTDIRVDAIAQGKPGSYPRLSVIVEAKGNWHPKLFENMETQLRDRYLKDNLCRHGIYLVGWFDCSNWKDGDRRKTKCRQRTMSKTKELLSAQAAGLSKDGLDIRSYILDARIQLPSCKSPNVK